MPPRSVPAARVMRSASSRGTSGGAGSTGDLARQEGGTHGSNVGAGLVSVHVHRRIHLGSGRPRGPGPSGRAPRLPAHGGRVGRVPHHQGARDVPVHGLPGLERHRARGIATRRRTLMRLVGLLIIVAGWLIAVGGLLATDSVEPRMVLAVVGFATSITGVVT